MATETKNHSWKNGDKYTGEFVDDIICGKGEFTWANGNNYRGEFKDDLMDG
jgi:hypothetical protein